MTRQIAVAVFCAGVLVLGLILLLPDFPYTDTYYSMLCFAASALKGRLLLTDVTTDFWGFQALVQGHDPYPILREAAARAGLVWDVPFASTHPPTAFLLVAPVAFLPVGLGVAIWSWSMLSLIIASFRLLGLSWLAAIGGGFLSLLWPPTALSLPQLTPIWMFAIAAAAYGGGTLAGSAIAVAAMTKFYPAILLWPFVVRGKFRPVIMFVSIGIVAVSVLALLDVGVFARYLEANKAASIFNITRSENAAPLVAPYQRWGIAGSAAVLAYLFSIWLVTFPLRRDHIFSVMLYAYLSIAFLPILWSLSTLPLLPIIFWFMRRVTPAAAVAAGSFIILLVCPRFGAHSVKYITTAVLLVGACFALESRATR